MEVSGLEPLECRVAKLYDVAVVRVRATVRNRLVGKNFPV